MARVRSKLLPSGLTELQEEFCQQFIVDLDGKAAAIRAGYSEVTAAVKACKMLKMSKIQDRIAVLKRSRMRRLGLAQEEVLSAWAEIGLFDIRELYHEDGRMKLPHELSARAAQVVAGVKVRQRKILTRNVEDEGEDEVLETQVEEVVEYKLNDKHTALTNAAKHLGLLKDTVEHDFTKTFKDLLDNLNPTMGPPGEKDVTDSTDLLKG